MDRSADGLGTVDASHNYVSASRCGACRGGRPAAAEGAAGPGPGAWALALPLLLLLLAAAGGVSANYPLFDVSTRMRILLVPSDARVGHAVYRLKASDSDFEYPLHFDVVSGYRQRARHGGKLRSHSKTLFTNRGSALDYIVVRNNPKNNRFAFLELRGSPLFDLKRALSSPDTVNNTIVLVGQLDFEQQVVHYLTVYATDAYAEPGNDTRNLLSFEMAVAVRDEQDEPPVFTRAPPVTRLSASHRQGDVVLRVEARDGDRGAPRAVRYGLVSESQPLAPFFHVDEHSVAAGVCTAATLPLKAFTVLGYASPD
ncbi:Cadherin-86C [Gryllus bimaculatus]|nr:Cadherin-86C [Gryllus bimaculatus]